jgi:transketolase
MSNQIKIFPQAAFSILLDFNESRPKHLVAAAFADMCRYNTLATVKKAGSGHLGSSFSSLDLLTWLYLNVLNISSENLEFTDRNIFFSSKGHDVPAQYAVLYALGIIPFEKFTMLRQLGGLDGHPECWIPGIEANSGSLGMGISKGKGMAWAKMFFKRQGHVFVITGDGEFQEGQNFEALQTVTHQGIKRLTVIMDHNKVQSDRYVNEIISLKNLKPKIREFGWKVIEIDGHNFSEIENALKIAMMCNGEPCFIIANTIKGRGVSFMEHLKAMQNEKKFYPFHAGAPSDSNYSIASEELYEKVLTHFKYLNLPEPKPISIGVFALGQQLNVNALGEPVSPSGLRTIPLKEKAEYIVEAFGDALVSIGRERTDLVVLSADLASDCRLRGFEAEFPERFVENGIAEQDMVSMAGGMARQGLLPIVNSFAAFLASRANEQIYNNATEHTKIVYAFHYAGIIPAGPGKSHQSIRDISLISAIPNITIIQPCNPNETKQALDYLINTCTENGALRMNIGPSPSTIDLPDNYTLAYGKGISLTKGDDALVLAYGPIMLHEAMVAAKLLCEEGIRIEVVNMPWLNRLDDEWFTLVVEHFTSIVVIDDHCPSTGLGDFLLRSMNRLELISDRKFKIWGPVGYPACGRPDEVLEYHALDGVSLCHRIKSIISKK